MSGLSSIDLTIVVVYLLGTLLFGAWMGRKQKGTTDYFLAGRQIPWPAVTLSIVATETSVLTFISIPAISYLGNMTFIQIVLGYLIGRILVALIVIPAYFKRDIQTAYHFFGHRFGQRMRNTASITFMATRVLADGVRLFATAIPLALIIKSSGTLSGLSDREFYALSILIIGALTIFYTYFGGIRAVIWLDVIQLIVYMTGAILAIFIILNKLPDGFASVTTWAASENKFEWFDLGAELSLAEFIKQPYTFFTALIAGAIFSVASHGTDQIIVQRILACKNQKAAQKAMIASGFAVLVQFFIFLMIGILLYTYYQGVKPEQLGVTQADAIFPKFIIEEMPSIIKGFILAALFAAAMSTLSSSVSSLASASVFDIYIPFAGKGKSDAELLKISRLVTLGWGVVLILTAFAFIPLQGTVVETALGIASYTYGGLLGTLILGLKFKQVSQTDAIVAFVTSLVVMAIVIATIQIAWPLYTVIGSTTAVLAGLISNKVKS